MVEHNWLLYIAAFACAFAITLVTTPFAKWLSVKCGAIALHYDRQHNGGWLNGGTGRGLLGLPSQKLQSCGNLYG